MIPLPPRIITGKYSDKILVQDFMLNQTVFLDVLDHSQTTLAKTHLLSILSMDKGELYHISEDFKLLSKRDSNFIMQLEDHPLAVVISDKAEKIAYIHRSEQLNTGKLTIKTFDGKDIAKVNDIALLDHVKLEGNEELDMIYMSSESTLGRDQERFVYNPNLIHLEEESFFLNNGEIYHHAIFNSTFCLSNEKELRVYSSESKRLLETSPNQSFIFSPDRQQLLIYHIDDLNSSSDLTLKYQILNRTTLETIEEGKIKLKSKGLPVLILDNDNTISQASYSNGKLRINSVK